MPRVKFHQGTLHIWKKDRWAVQFYLPWIVHAHPGSWMLDMDTAARVGLREGAAGLRVLGFGFGITRLPSPYSGPPKHKEG